MVPKSKKPNVEENPFLPPPVDLDRISLVDKDYLISETRSEFNFTELQSWFKDTFIDQSDVIGLWESNFCNWSGETFFLITPEAIDQMMQAPRVNPHSSLTIEILTEMY
jgi:hypothetical protein